MKLESQSILQEFEQENHQRVQKYILYGCSSYVLVVGILFIYTDIYISGFPKVPFWRLPSVLVALVLFLLLFTSYRNYHKQMYFGYLLFQFLIAFMMAGIAWDLFPDTALDRTYNGLLLATIVIFVGSSGNYKTLIITYLPLLILPVILWWMFHPPIDDILQYANILALIMSCLFAVQILYQLRFKAFKNRRQAEVERNKANVALAELRATQNQLIQAEKMASLGELTAGIAHEIQNPLNFVNNFSEVSAELMEEMEEELKNGEISEVLDISSSLKANLEKIRFHGKRADSIVKGMLLHSRESSGEKEEVDINTMCDEYLRLAYHGLRAKDQHFNASFQINVDPQIKTVKMYRQDVGRLLLNLINNAFQAVSTKKRNLGNDQYDPLVTILTKQELNYLKVVIEDNGVGIPETIQKKIFQPFFTTKPPGEGTGLGLSLVYDIVQKHHGHITVESKEGIGTKFIIHFPIVNDDD